jgi:hypothetical protein
MNPKFTVQDDAMQIAIPLYRKIELQLTLIVTKQTNGGRGLQISPAIIWTSFPIINGPFMRVTSADQLRPRSFSVGGFLLLWDLIIMSDLAIVAPWSQKWVDRYNAQMAEVYPPAFYSEDGE